MARVRFGDVVKEIKINIDRATDDHEFYIAGEHMESENIHLTKRGRFEGTDVGPAFIRLFRPGQVLYGSRRTYLKKVAVADFEGITSNTTFVLETKDQNVMMQELLPFIMLTDSFTEYTIKNSKGSTNPYILFSDLCAYEFELPCIEDQRLLVERLLACDSAKEAYKRLLAATDDLVKSQFIEMFGRPGENNLGWEMGTIRDIVSDVRYGSSRKASDDGKYPYLRMNNITYNGELDLSDTKWIDIPDNELAKCTVQRGDVLFNRTNSKELVGKTCLYNRDELMVLAGFIVRVRMNDRAIPEFLVQYMNLPYMKEYLLAMCKAACGQANINAQELQSIPIYIPPVDIQKMFVGIKEQADKSKFVARQATSYTYSMIKWK